jgi:alkylhydroperoxidase family enzyme
MELVHVIGFFNHINRVADALGVDLESWMSPADPRKQ